MYGICTYIQFNHKKSAIHVGIDISVPMDRMGTFLFHQSVELRLTNSPGTPSPDDAGGESSTV